MTLLDHLAAQLANFDELMISANDEAIEALCDERRQRILELLHGGEKCACMLMEEMCMPQSSLSYHMKILCDSGIVESREEGKWTHYRISRPGSENAIALLRGITAVQESGDRGSNCCI